MTTLSQFRRLQSAADETSLTSRLSAIAAAEQRQHTQGRYIREADTKRPAA